MVLVLAAGAGIGGFFLLGHSINDVIHRLRRSLFSKPFKAALEAALTALLPNVFAAEEVSAASGQTGDGIE